MRVRRWSRSSASPSSAPSSGVSTTAAKKLVGHALELRHRLPRLWAQVHAGRIPAWRARAVAEATIHSTPALTREAAGFVDAQVAAVAGRVGAAQLDRLVAETIKRFDLAGLDPSSDPEDGYLHVDPRHATLHDDDVHYAGTIRMEAELDIADALDLDRALAHRAATLKALGSTAPLDARRAAALGDLARTQTALDLHTRGATGARDVDGLPAAREVVLHAHFDAALDGLDTVFGPTGRMEEAQRLRAARPGPATGAATPAPRSPSSRSSTSPPSLADTGVRGARPDPRTGDTPRPRLRVPVVHPPGPRLRHRPRHRIRPPRRGRGQATTRPHPDPESRRAVPVPPPLEDPHRLALPDDRARGVRVDLTARPPLPTRPPRHHRDSTEPSHPTRPTSRTTPTMTPPHTPPPTR